MTNRYSLVSKIASWVCVSFAVFFVYSVVTGDSVESSFLSEQVSPEGLG